jgi:hypothetical protein
MTTHATTQVVRRTPVHRARRRPARRRTPAPLSSSALLARAAALTGIVAIAVWLLFGTPPS